MCSSTVHVRMANTHALNLHVSYRSAGTLPFAKSLLKEKYCGKAPEATDVLIQVV